MTLHVTNGDSAANTLRETALGGEVLPWRDALHEGPVPATSREELLRTRARFLAECGQGQQDALLAALEERDRLLLTALRDDDVVLWFEHDLYDQLQLIDVLALAHAERAAPELIVIGSFPGRPAFAGLGELTASELESLWPARRAAQPAALEAAVGAWDAVRRPEPTALVEWATRAIPELPFLAPALLRLLEELPAVAGGLSGTERRALQAIAAGARTPHDAFVAAQRREDAPFLGDTWFFRALDSLTPELVETDAGELHVSPTGEQVLHGGADRVELLGIDRWVGGTHVTPDNAWRWDADRLRATRE